MKTIPALLLLVILLASCGPATIAAPVTSWFGMQVPSETWQTQTLENTLYRHGLLTHRLLSGCRVSILSMDPVNAGGTTADWENSSHERMTTDRVELNLWKVRDMHGDVFTTYFEVLDITGQSGYDIYRLAYFAVEPGAKPVECLDATYQLLNTLRPDQFPNIGTAQG